MEWGFILSHHFGSRPSLAPLFSGVKEPDRDSKHILPFSVEVSIYIYDAWCSIKHVDLTCISMFLKRGIGKSFYCCCRISLLCREICGLCGVLHFCTYTFNMMCEGRKRYKRDHFTLGHEDYNVFQFRFVKAQKSLLTSLKPSYVGDAFNRALGFYEIYISNLGLLHVLSVK